MEYKYTQTFDPNIMKAGDVLTLPSGAQHRKTSSGSFETVQPVSQPQPEKKLIPRITEDPNLDIAKTTQKSDEYSAMNPRSKEDIRSEEISNQRERIDAIEGVYRNIIEGKKEESNVRQGGLRAMAASFGWGGAPTALSERSKEANYTAEQIATINAQKALEINKVYDLVDQRTDEIYNAEKGASKDAYDAIIKRSKTEGETALESVASSLRVPYSAATKEDPEFFTKIKKMTGYSDYQIEKLYNSSLPKELQATSVENYIPSEGGSMTILRKTTIDPLTKKQTTTDYTIDVPYAILNQDKLLKDATGGLWMIGEDGKASEITPGKPVAVARGGTLVDPKTGKVIARGQPFETVDKTDKLTSSEWRQYYSDLPATLIGQSEDDILKQLNNETPPEWYIEKVNPSYVSGGQMTPYVSKEAKTKWNEYRKVALENIKSQAQKKTTDESGIPDAWK